MENCKTIHENIFAYVGNELPLIVMQQLDTHVDECIRCAALVADFKSVIVLMEKQKYIEPKPFAETRIMQAINSRPEKKLKLSSPIFVRILQPAFISLGILAAMAIGFLIGSDFANAHSQYSQNEEITEAVRSDLNVPDFMTDDIFYFSE